MEPKQLRSYDRKAFLSLVQIWAQLKYRTDACRAKLDLVENDRGNYGIERVKGTYVFTNEHSGETLTYDSASNEWK
jgi:hypothetical protein